MKRLLLPLLAALALPAAVSADLGEAETKFEYSSFEAYCGKSGNKCKVIFDENKMRVNQSKGISKDQLIRYSYIGPEFCVFGCSDLPWVIFYKKKDGTNATAKIIFRNAKKSIEFGKAMEVFGGTELREIGPNIQVELKDASEGGPTPLVNHSN